MAFEQDKDYKIKYSADWLVPQAWVGKRLIVRGGTLQDYLDRGFELIGDSNDAEVAKFNELTEKYKAGTLTKDQYENELISNNI